MRELGIIPDQGQARALADFLLTQDIATKVVANRDGRFAVWVQREDRVEPARQVYADFLQNPDDPRFLSATRSAREIRKRAEDLETEHRKRSHQLRDRWDGPLYRRAPITFALIVVSIAAFAGEEFYRDVYYWLAFSLTLITPDGPDRDLGFALIRQGQVWRLITPIFMHFGVWHIAFNMLALSAFGQGIEMVKGRWRFLVLVLGSAIASNVAQSFVSGGNFGGMSGVDFALAGYLWMKGQVAPEQGLGLSNQNAQWMVGWLLIGIIAPILFPSQHGFPFNMANLAHGVGLGAGLVLAWLRL